MINRHFASNSRAIKIATKGFKYLLNSLFPPICLGCEASIGEGMLCKVCSDLLTPLTPHDRCWSCFQERPCSGCNTSPFARSASLFPSFGPALDILKALPTAPYLAKSCSALILHQLEALSFPTPDLIVSGHRKDQMLADALSKWFGILHIKALAPAGRGSVQLRRGKRLCNKKALLVTTQWGPHCEGWGEVLQEAFPARLDGIAFCLPQHTD